MPLQRWTLFFLPFFTLCCSGVNHAAAEEGPVAGQAKQSPGTEQAQSDLLAMHRWKKNENALDLKTSFSISNSVLDLNSRGTVRFRIQRPNSFHVEVVSGGKRELFVTDGKLLTIYRPQKKVYAQLFAEDSILGTMFKAIGGLTLQAKLIEFFWTVDYLSIGAEDVKVTAGGSTQIRGKTCRKYQVVRALEAWDVWIAQGDTPYPCRLISRTKDQSASTVQSNEVTWTLKPSFNSAVFAFKPPANARKVSMSGLE